MSRGPACFGLDFAQLFFDDLENARFFREDVAQVFDRLDQLLVFVGDFVALEAGELIKAEIENLIRLVLAEGVTAIDEPRFVANQDADLFDLLSGEFEGEQFDPRFVAIGGTADDADEFIEIRQRDEITFQRFGAILGLAQFEARPAEDDFAAMLDIRQCSLP